MSHKPWIAMIALRDAVLPEAAEIFDRLRRDGSPMPEIAERGQKENVVAFSLGGNPATIALVPGPIPWSALEGPCATAWYWPQAAASLQDHAAHLIVALMPESGEIIENALALTRLTAAVTSVSHALGIYWGSGRLVHAPEAFVEESRRMSREQLPLYLWISFRLDTNADGTLCLFTTGLEAFGHMEIEVAASRSDPQSLVDQTFNIAHHLLDHGPVLKDGDTIGLSENEKISIAHVPSMWDEQKRVIRLEL